MNNKHLPLGIDLFFCLVLLPALIMLLPVERWLENNSTFVILLVGWLYAVYFLTRKACVPMLFRSRRQLIIALCMLEKPCDFAPFGQTGLSPLATI